MAQYKDVTILEQYVAPHLLKLEILPIPYALISEKQTKWDPNACL